MCQRSTHHFSQKNELRNINEPSTNSIASELEEFLAGSPGEKAIYLIGGGVALLVIGLVLVLRPKRK
ncbi:MAG: DUF3185 family protein [Candidatus Aminicenantes bacterium]